MKPALVRLIDWRRAGDKSLFELIKAHVSDAIMRHQASVCQIMIYVIIRKDHTYTYTYTYTYTHSHTRLARSVHVRVH